METKKYEHRRMERKIPLFYMIGLNVAILLTILAFEIKTDPIEPKVPTDTGVSIFEEPVYIPPTKFEPPKPQPTRETIREVKEEVAEEPPIEEIIEKPEPINETDVTGLIENLPPIIDSPENERFIVVEEMPSYPGGWEAFYAFVGKNMKYPKSGQRMGVEGKVHLQFVIEKDGSISDLQVVKGMVGGFNEEAIRVMNLLPKFNPGKQRGKPVRVQQAITIYFKLGN